MSIPAIVFYYGKKEQTPYKVANKNYDFICYCVCGSGVLLNQTFLYITNPNGKVLICGIPAEVETCCTISYELVNWLTVNGFSLNDEAILYATRDPVNNMMRVFSNLFSPVNVIYATHGNLSLVREEPTVVLKPTEQPKPTEQIKPVWAVIPARKWTEINPTICCLKIVPNGEDIRICINDSTYKDYSNMELNYIRRIQNKPYALVYLGKNQSVMMFSNKEIYYKPAAEMDTEFCFRDCNYNEGFEFHASNVVNVYSLVDGKIVCEGTTITPLNKKIANCYIYNITVAYGGIKKFDFIKSEQNNIGIYFVIERKIL